MKKVLFYANIPSPYRVDFFNELGKYCELTVVFERASSAERDESWKNQSFKNFQGIILDGISFGVDMAICPKITKYLVPGRYDVVIVQVLASPTAQIVVNTLKRRKIPYIFEGDGGFTGPVEGLKAKLKRNVVANATKCFSTSKEFDNYLMAYGAKLDDIIRYPLSSYAASEIRAADAEQKQALRLKYNIKEELAVVSVGRMIQLKRHDVLLRAAEKMPQNVGIYIIGGEPTEDLKEIVDSSAAKDRIHFLDFMPRAEVMEFFRACDIFTFLSSRDVWGLVVGEAMAAGLPVIGTEGSLAAREMIIDGENGYLISNGSEKELSDRVNTLADGDLRSVMSQKAMQRAAEYTIEKMVDTHLMVI